MKIEKSQQSLKTLKNFVNNIIEKMQKQAITLITVLTALSVYHLSTNLSEQSPQLTHKQLVIQSLDINMQDLFNQWKLIYNKNYQSSEQETYRLKVFISTCRKVYHHNMNKDSIGYTYEMGLNSFSDLTKEEYINMLTTYPTREHYKTQVERSKLLNLTLSCTGNITTSPNPPDQVDWSKKAVTAVVKQGACGSSYAIAAIGAIEALYSLKYGKLDTMSYQQVLDCSGAYGNQGCQGGFMDQAFWYIIDNGLASSKTYPNKNINQNCTYTKSMKTTSITRCADVPTGSYIKLQSSVIQGPTTVAIDASEMKDYKTGIYNKPCSSTYINQAMLVVGYGVEDNQTYWKIKNSFGADWGEDGYLRLERTVTEGEGKCGIQQVAVTPQVLI